MFHNGPPIIEFLAISRYAPIAATKAGR